MGKQRSTAETMSAKRWAAIIDMPKKGGLIKTKDVALRLAVWILW